MAWVYDTHEVPLQSNRSFIREGWEMVAKLVLRDLHAGVGLPREYAVEKVWWGRGALFLQYFCAVEIGGLGEVWCD